MKKTAILMLAAGMTVLAMPAAYAYDSDIRSDWRQVQRDRARLRTDEARLRDERRELVRDDERENERKEHRLRDVDHSDGDRCAHA